MQISQITYSNYKTNWYSTVQKKEPVFCAKKITRFIIKDLCTKNSEKGLTSISDIAAGRYGTVCKGSIPLSNFFRQMDSRKIQILKQIGISTNTQGIGSCFLKSTAAKPLSTSFVQSCSVMYLYNKSDNIHFMYHIFQDIQKTTLDFLIKHFMKNGYTDAAIVPGHKWFKDTHELYLSKVFEAIQTNNPKAKINVYHFSSHSPEIVGYKGMVYEITNDNTSKALKEGGNLRYILPTPQATFKIQNVGQFPDLYDLSFCNDLKSINAKKEKIKKEKYDIEIKQVLISILDERRKDIQRIENCSSMEELDRLGKELYDRDIQSYFNWGYKGYQNLIAAKRNSL